jgi:hypothetical protein
VNFVRNGTNNVARLNPGEFCPMGSYQTYGVRTDDKLFDALNSTQWTINSAGILPATLAMRVADGTPIITGYDLQYWNASVSRYLSGWSVDGSRDGTTWEQLHSVTNFVPLPPATVGGGVNWWYSTGTGTPSNGFSIADGRMTNAQLRAGTQVSVAAGAKLTFLGGTEPLGALSIDCDAGGGTISDLLLAQTGRIDLTGSSILGRNFAVPLTITTFTNPELLRYWSLYINGQLVQGAVLRWNATTKTLRVFPLGTLLMMN